MFKKGSDRGQPPQEMLVKNKPHQEKDTDQENGPRGRDLVKKKAPQHEKSLKKAFKKVPFSGKTRTVLLGKTGGT